MKKSKLTTKRKSIKAIAIASLLVVLLVSLATLSYAWYRNYIDIKGTSVTTGSISFSLESYNVDVDGNVSGPQTFDTTDEPESSVVLESDVTRIRTWNNVPHHVYYLIKNPASDTSINLDASLQLSLDNTEVPDYIGGISVAMTQVATGEIADDFTNETDVKTEIENALDSVVVDSNRIAFSDLSSAYQEFSVKKGEYVCLRLSYVIASNVLDYTNIDIGLRVSFCLAQEGGLPGANTATEYVVYSNDGFMSALGKYRPNDKIIVKGNVNYIGDLVFNRPLRLAVQNSTLTVNGNLMYVYPYQGQFTVDTSTGGTIAVLKKAVELTDEAGNVTGYSYVGGNFEISTPSAQIEFIGKNSPVVGRGDVYVQNEFSVSASKTSVGSNTGNGFIVNESRIIKTNGTIGDSEEFAQVNAESYTKITVLNHSVIGKIVAKGKVIEIENRGTIEEIDLYDMVHDNTYIDVSGNAIAPQIFIDNYGQLVNTQILLPINWATKYGTTGEGINTGNTQIVSNPGAGFMTTNECKGFHSDGSRNPALDDIEYVKLTTFVEKVNGLQNDIIVSYTSDTDMYIVETDKKVGSSLQSLIEYYSGVKASTDIANSTAGYSVPDVLKISPANEITSMKIVCLNKEMTSADYAYIKTNMTQLRSLDLSDAYTVDRTVPASSLSDMANLTDLKPSEYDGVWGHSVIKGTGIKEIHLPESLTNIGIYNFDTVKYIHTNSSLINTVYSSPAIKLVPDEATYLDYNKEGNVGKVFLDATVYKAETADYLFRLNDESATCEFVTVIGNTDAKIIDMSVESVSNFLFDFNSVTIEEKKYDILSYDRYAFYDKTFYNVAGVTFSEKIQEIKSNAFTSVEGISEIIFEGESIVLGEEAFASSSITKVTGLNLTKIDRRAFAKMTALNWANLPLVTECNIPFDGCGAKLTRVDIGPLKDGSVVLNANHARYLFIHTNGTEIPPSYILPNQAWNERMTFLPSTHSGLFSSIGNKIVLPEGYTVSDIKEYYNPLDPAVRNGLHLPNLLYIENEDGTVNILACCDTLITSSDDAFLIPRENGNGNYVVTEIGKCAYTFTNINIVGDLVLPETITKVNDYAFSVSLNGTTEALGTAYSTKIYVRLRLNNVTTLGISAFRGNNFVELIGPKVNTIWQYVFANNTSLIKMEMPSWRNSQKSSSWGYYFHSCSSLRMAIIGPTDQGTGDWAFYYAPNLSLVIVDGTIAPAKMPSGNFQAYGENVNPLPIVFYKGAISGNYTSNVKVAKYEDMCLCDFVTNTKIINGVEYTYSLPSTVYYKTENGGSVGFAKYMASSIEGTTYTIPQRIKAKTGSTQEFFGDTIQEYTEVIEGEEGYPVTAISSYSFFKISLGDKTFNTGKFVTSIGSSVFSGSAIKSLILENVETLGSYAFSGSSLTSLTANRLKTVGDYAFQNCKNLKELTLPAVQKIGIGSFMGSGVQTVNLGENLTSINYYAFCNCASLQEVVIRSETPITVPSGTAAQKQAIFYYSSYKGTPINTLRILVRASIEDSYKGGWQSIPEANVSVFELSWYDEVNDITYFFNQLDGNNVEVSSMKTDTVLSGTYTFPSSFTNQTLDEEGNVTSTITYTVTKITDNFMSFLASYGEITKYVLPTNLEEFASDYSLIAPYVRELEITSANANYATVNGVLYSKNMTTLLFYPRYKADETFTVPSTVKIVVEEAFAGVMALEEVTFTSEVILSASVFEGCNNLTKVTFSEGVSFAGRNIFNGCHEDLEIFVPADKLNAIKDSVIYDKDIVDRIKAIA